MVYQNKLFNFKLYLLHRFKFTLHTREKYKTYFYIFLIYVFTQFFFYVFLFLSYECPYCLYLYVEFMHGVHASYNSTFHL